jgi:redox-sensing transcriptional repressor
MIKTKISRSVIPRLSVYYRALASYKEGGEVSSRTLSELTGFSAAQIRRDLTYFGQFGTPGRGYVVSDLKKEILKILGIDKLWNVILVGVGNLGTALLSYKGFHEQGFNITAALDSDPRKVGKKIGGIVVGRIDDLKKAIQKKNAQMAIVTVPSEAAQETINSLVEAGVKSILNFAPIRPRVPASVELINIDLSIELEKLAHFLGTRKAGG